MSSYRQLATPDNLMARVATLWSFASSAVAPVFIVVGGVVASAASVRATLWISAALMAGSALLLPRTDEPATDEPGTEKQSAAVTSGAPT
jgi:hypothetical protein